ncbi:hypothetical protein Golax_013865, partial [Gossypium laxum]|nr:hypothetical protein [Gossypium laxum]
VVAAHLVLESQLVLRVLFEGGDVHWCCSSVGKFKCNFDGTIFTGCDSMGWAVVLRNDIGGFVRCSTGFVRSNLDIFMVEVLTTRDALFRLK